MHFDNSKISLLVCALLVISILCGCASSSNPPDVVAKQEVSAEANIIKTRVNRIHTLPAILEGKTFMFVPQEIQIGDADYMRYARTITAQFKKLGMQYHDDTQATSPDYLIFINYGMNERRENIPFTTTRMRLDGSTSLSGGGVSAVRTYDEVEIQPPLKTTYAHYINLAVVDAAKAVEIEPTVLKTKSAVSTARQLGAQLYGGSATAISAKEEPPSIMAALIGALFVDFPGKSGKVEDYTSPR